MDLPKDKSTEEKIKLAAEKIFLERGFSASRTRDIAEEAGINLALLNYYFRSKKNLFDIIMMEKLEVFFDVIINVLKENKLDFQEKMSVLVNKYTDLLIHEPNLPLFLMSEIQQNPDFFATKMNIKSKLSDIIGDKPLFDGKNQEEDLQLLLSFLGITIFPFIVRQSFQGLFNMNVEQYNEILNKRRDLIPKLIMKFYDELKPE